MYQASSVLNVMQIIGSDASQVCQNGRMNFFDHLSIVPVEGYNSGAYIGLAVGGAIMVFLSG